MDSFDLGHKKHPESILNTIWNSHKVLKHSCFLVKLKNQASCCQSASVKARDGLFKTVNLSLTGIHNHEQLVARVLYVDQKLAPFCHDKALT